MIRGVVSGYQQRYEQITTRVGPRMLYVWSFRVEQQDAAGNPMPRVSVEMRAASFLGTIENGDFVEIDEPFERGQLVQTHEVRNVSAGAWVEAKGELALRRSQLIAWILFVGILIIVIAVVLFFQFAFARLGNGH